VPWPAALVFAATGGWLWWRVSAWPPSQSADAWAYVAWGQGLARGERPLYDHALTAPKPLGLLLGALVSPLPPQRAFQAAVIAMLAVGAAALFWAAFRAGGTIGAVAAVGVLGTSLVVGGSLGDALIDAIAAALVMLAIATRGRVRLAVLFVLGLGRPEAWILSAVAAYADSEGSMRRRLAASAAWALAAPALWVAIDYGFTGDPLASMHRNGAVIDVTRGGRTASLGSLPSLTFHAVLLSIGPVAAALGSAGLVAAAVCGIRRRRWDPLPVAVLAGWTAGIVAETGSVPFKARFLFPVGAALLFGIACLAGVVVPRRLWGNALLAGIAASAVFALGTAAVRTPSSRLLLLERAVPPIRQALTCGPVRITGRATGIPGHRPGTVTPILAALTRHRLDAFLVGPGSRPVSARFILGRERPPAGWSRRGFAFGTVAVSPACARGAPRFAGWGITPAPR
jgi:hypothetical protein